MSQYLPSSTSSPAATVSPSSSSATAAGSDCLSPLHSYTIDAKLRLNGLYFDDSALLLHSIRLQITAEFHGSSTSDAFAAKTYIDSRVISAHTGGGSSRCDASVGNEGREVRRMTCASEEGGLSREEEEKARVDIVVQVRHRCGGGDESSDCKIVSRAISHLPFSASACVYLPPITLPPIPSPPPFRYRHRFYQLRRSPRSIYFAADL
jgi:hypothetical protein